MILRAAPHLQAVFQRATADARVRQAVEVLGRVNLDVLVVSGISGTVLGSRVAAAIGCDLAVVRRPGEARKTRSGNAYDVEGYLGGNWVFFDDLVSTGRTRVDATDAYKLACRQAHEAEHYLGDFMHWDGRFYPGGSAPTDMHIPF
jgi:adenine/guanine phosphoribosyltransferase-like PRPP-binding protein